MNLFFWRKKKKNRGGVAGGKRAGAGKQAGGGGMDLDALGISADDPEWESKLRSVLAERGHQNPDKAVERARKRFARRA